MLDIRHGLHSALQTDLDSVSRTTATADGSPGDSTRAMRAARRKYEISYALR